jgi:putative oxidoreductase
MAAAGLLVLRLTLAIVMVAHGAHDLFGAFAGAGMGSGGLSRGAEYFASLGLQPPFVLAVSAGSLQFAGGLLLAAGLLTRWVAAVAAAYFSAIGYIDAARWGFFLNATFDQTRGNGYEYLLVLAGGLAALALMGAGEWSLDGLRATSAHERAAGRARLRRR